jgi:hypothetical protein
VGCWVIPKVADEGVGGCGFTIAVVPAEIQPSLFLTLTVYVPVATTLNVVLL